MCTGPIGKQYGGNIGSRRADRLLRDEALADAENSTERQIARKTFRASRKEARAEKALGRGNEKRAGRLTAKAGDLRDEISDLETLNEADETRPDLTGSIVQSAIMDARRRARRGQGFRSTLSPGGHFGSAGGPAVAPASPLKGPPQPTGPTTRRDNRRLDRSPFRLPTRRL